MASAPFHIRFVLLLLVLLTACGGGAAKVPSEPPPGVAPAASLNIVAKANKYDKNALVAAAQAPISLHFDNQDVGVLHNVAFYRDSSVAELIFQGETFAGRKAIDETIPAQPAGDYYFRCDVHPEMRGAYFVR
jgi:hypothetical protein